MAALSEWDPLSYAGVPSDLENDARKRGIDNLLQSYTGYFDVFSELIQNALDAVDRRVETEGDSYEPKISVEIDLPENSVTVTDNGVGFTREQFQTFLAPNVSFKVGRSRGNKGVGATYLAYGFNHLEMGTKTPDFTGYAKITGGREWVAGKYGAQRPKVQSLPLPANFLDAIDRGSIFRLKLIGDHIRPSDLSWMQAETAGQWAAILRVKTPLGGIYIGRDTPKTKCLVKVASRKVGSSELVLEKCAYFYPHNEVASASSLREIQLAQQEATKRAKDPWKDVPAKFRNLDGIYEFWNTADILSGETIRPILDEQEKKLIESNELSIYGFFGYSVSLWDYVNDSKYHLRQGQRILSGGLQVATTNMPQGGLIVIPLTKSIGYQKTSHVVVHVSAALPDYGRKGFQPEVQGIAEKLSVTVVNYLSRWHPLLKKEVSGVIDLGASRELHDWIVAQEQFAKENPLEIRNENFFVPTRKISVLSMPQKEQDVIVLFNQLIAGGVIRGIRILSTSQHKQYDSLCRIVVTAPAEIQEFDSEKNPLGILGPIKEAESEPWVLEYKVSLDDLIREFGKEEKEEKDVNLVVCWDAGSEWKENYAVTSLLVPDNVHLRPFHGATHEVRNTVTGNRVFYMIVLSDLIAYLNDRKKSDESQAQKYTV